MAQGRLLEMSFNTLEEKLETRAKAILDANSTFAGYSITVSKGEDERLRREQYMYLN